MKIKKFEYKNNELYNNRIINDPITNKKTIKRFRIPKSLEIEKILKKSHDDRNHCGIYATNYYLNQQNIYWISIINDIKNYIQNCITCIKMKLTEKIIINMLRI